MLWEWLVMPQGLKNAPATFTRVVAHVMRQHRAYAPHYFDDVFVHSRAEDGLSAIESHKSHLDAVLQTLGDAQLYVSLQKCMIGFPEIPVLGCIVGAHGVRADPEKEQEDAFTLVKQSLVDAPVLALPDSDTPFSVVCDASNLAISIALMQKDDSGVERVISYQFRLLKAAELN
ncbi:unnamed protein product [Peronospora effusa]|nr:unnamed protein product [Peronospora effusa]